MNIINSLLIKHLFLLIFVTSFTFAYGNGDNKNKLDSTPQNANELTHEQTLDIVTWNLEWFGAPSKSHHATSFSQQLKKVSEKIISLDADIYALQEVVSDKKNGDFFQPLLSKLNELAGSNKYAGIMSPMYSFYWKYPSTKYPAQRLCFIYNTNTVDKINDEALFEQVYKNYRKTNNNIVGYDGDSFKFWSSGRVPYMLKAKITIGDEEEIINFINIHAKCCNDSKTRRKNDANYLNNYMVNNMPDDNIIILGDYNQRYNKYTGAYKSFYADNFKNFKNTAAHGIDRMSISNELYDEFNLLTNDTYYENVNISDHNPVIMRILLSTLSSINNNKIQLVRISPNPASQNIFIETKENKSALIQIINFSGKVILNKNINGNSYINISSLYSGIYILKIKMNNEIITKKIVIN